MTQTAGCPDVTVLSERHMISVMLYLLEHDGCKKTDIYRDVSRVQRFPEKLELLRDNGLIDIRKAMGNTTIISLTQVGTEIAQHLVEMQAIMAGTET